MRFLKIKYKLLEPLWKFLCVELIFFQIDLGRNRGMILQDFEHNFFFLQILPGDKLSDPAVLPQ